MQTVMNKDCHFTNYQFTKVDSAYKTIYINGLISVYIYAQIGSTRAAETILTPLAFSITHYSRLYKRHSSCYYSSYGEKIFVVYCATIIIHTYICQSAQNQSLPQRSGFANVLSTWNQTIGSRPYIPYTTLSPIAYCKLINTIRMHCL